MLIELQHPFNLLQHNINIVNYLQLCHPGVSSFRHQLLLLRTSPLSLGPLVQQLLQLWLQGHIEHGQDHTRLLRSFRWPASQPTERQLSVAHLTLP